jgi:predicted O-methyltransferase YrrM
MIKGILNGKKIDFLFIDGDHSYLGVKKDFELYAPLVKRGGIIAFHDIVPSFLCPEVKVHKFWNEIKINYRYKEIVKDPNQDAYGIGVLYV